jgi:hypothetical protein
MAKLKLSTPQVILVPIDPNTEVPGNNTLYVDSNTNKLSNKDSAGATSDIATSISDAAKKQMQSGQAAAIAAGTPLSKLPDGKIVAGDSDAAGGQAIIGIALGSFSGLNSLAMVHCVGQNVQGILTGLGFVPGEEIYLGETGGYTNNPGAFTGANDSIIKLGIADCTAGAASGTAVDLIMFPEVVARP